MFVNYIIAVLSILLYLHGFFPIPARPTQESPPNNVTGAHPRHRRAVIIIIDALRLDFVDDVRTPFLAKAYKSTGCFIHLKVETPTVTLPRIKALTTGNVPQFVDIILNLASPTKVEDSFIHRAHARGKRIVFYGDDIWVKLFPEQFVRSEGTSSFFVNDYTEVDDNVTRNVRIENKRKDWDIMILHYLGLDHIGHVYGPKSPLITTKLAELDSIIEEIYRRNGDALIVVTGDHGMRDSGGHGGSTFAETNVPLVLLRSECYNDTFPQIDIPANLALLLGFDIPATSIGRLQDSLLMTLPSATYLEALKYNTILLRSKLDLCQDTIDTATYFHELFLLNRNQTFAENASKMYKDCAQVISDSLQKTSVRQNLGSLIIATLTGVTILLKILQYLCQIEQRSALEQVAILTILFLQLVNMHPTSSFVLVVVILLFCARNLVALEFKQLKVKELSFLTVMSVIHPLIFLSSSFLEEEHQFWYFFAGTFAVVNILTSKSRFRWLLLFVGLRFIRTMNQVGDKWASWPDLADWLLQTGNFFYLQLIFITGLVLTLYCNSFFSKNTVINVIDVLVIVLVYIFRMVLNEEVTLGKTVWLLILIRFLLSLATNEGFVPTWVLIIALLLKPYNVILIPFCVLSSQLFHNVLKNETLIMAHWWLGNLLFFAQGHDNSLASVDISSGYIGLSHYNPLFVFPQVLCHTYALPVLSHLLLFTNRDVNVRATVAIFVLFRLYTVVVVFLVTFIHRHHLFIWSVFAPKMFVEASHFGFLFIEICCYYIQRLIKKLLLCYKMFS